MSPYVSTTTLKEKQHEDVVTDFWRSRPRSTSECRLRFSGGLPSLWDAPTTRGSTSLGTSPWAPPTFPDLTRTKSRSVFIHLTGAKGVSRVSTEAVIP